MAAIANTSKNSLGAFTPASVALATSGDTLTYNANTGQELFLTNTSVSDVVVTIDGSGGTTVAVPGAGSLTASVAAGLAVTVTAGTTAVVRLDTIPAYLVGTVAITAATGVVVKAFITV